MPTSSFYENNLTTVETVEITDVADEVLAAAANIEINSASAANSAAIATQAKLDAQTSAVNSAASAAAASATATNVNSIAVQAATSASSSAASATAAETSAANAATSASAAAGSVSAANTAKVNAETAAAVAQDWATKTNAEVIVGQGFGAKKYATDAATSATSASTSATTATTKAAEASTSATTATTQAGIATTKAAEASTSATNAAAYELSANNWATKTGSAVAGGEFSAKYHAQQAASSASSASSSASTASTARIAAEAARDQTLAAFDSFDDRYLGTKTSDPTLDNDGNALVAGSLYFNSAAGTMKVYTGSAWVAAYVSGTDFLPLAGGTLTGPLTLSGNASSNLHAVPKQQLDTGLAAKADSTHGHAISDVTGLQTALDGKQASGSYANATHTHAISDVTNLQTSLDAKAASTHAHAISDVTGLQTVLDGKQAAGSYAAATHSHAISDVTGLQTALDGKQAAGSYASATHSHAISDVTDLQTALDGKLATSGGTLTQVSQAIVAVAASAIDCSAGNYFTKTASGALTWTVTNVPSAKAYSFILELTNGGTGTQTWFSGVKWPAGTAPTLTASGVDVLGFITDDGGTTWRGVQLMKDSK